MLITIVSRTIAIIAKLAGRPGGSVRHRTQL